MRAILILILVVFSPILALADVQWLTFGTNFDRETFTIGHTTITFEALQNVPNYQQVPGDQPGDDLVMTVQAPGRKASRYYFNSAYGYGSFAVHGNTLLLMYGIGRGTRVRTDHIKALCLDHDLDEVVDVQSSYYVLTNPHNAAPDLFVYSAKIQTEGGYTTLSLSLPKPRNGLPSEKIVRWKNDR